MGGYKPLQISGNETGLVQNREEFLLPADAYPVLQNAYVWRERILRKKGYQLLGRLARELISEDLGNSGTDPWDFNFYTALSITGEPNAQIQPQTVIIYVNTTTPATGSILTYNNASNCEVTTTAPHGLSTEDVITISGVITDPDEPGYINGGPYTISVVSPTSFTINQNSLEWPVYVSGGTWTEDVASEELFDDGLGGLITRPPTVSRGTINYNTGDIVVTGATVGDPSAITALYYPGLPVMGICKQELNNSNYDQTLFFDQKYCYIFAAGVGAFNEFLPATTTRWNAANLGIAGTDFFWSTNYWISGGASSPFSTTDKKLFWVTNGSGQSLANSDPPRITDGSQWVDFDSGGWHQIDATNFLFNWLCMLPFRGRMVTFNTWEGVDKNSLQNFRQRIRWATIGNPFIAYDAGPPAKGSWRSDIRGQGGFLDIPTSEDIVSVGFVRDNLVIYCERSTWQLRYTGRSIAPFQIEKVNSELGAEGTFSTVQFDTSLVGIGDKGIVECDSYKSERIDIKIPDYVFYFNRYNNGPERIQGIRDFQNRLAYWTVPVASYYDGSVSTPNWIFPNQRLVYNYENDSWATFDDSLTALGTYQTQSSRTWINTKKPWIECNFSWIDQPQQFPSIVGGNQQGYVEYLDELNTNDFSLAITGIMFDPDNATVIKSPNHNLRNGTVIEIGGIPTGTAYSNLNDGIFAILLGDQNGQNQQNYFRLTKYNAVTGQFSDNQVDTDPGSEYLGGGQFSVRDNFIIQSKKFGFVEDGQSIQVGYIDLLMAATGSSNPGSISMNVYLDYDTSNASNTVPKNVIPDTEPDQADTFFNAVIPTSPSQYAMAPQGTKFWQRVFCPTRANFLTLEYTFSNAQMAGIEQTLPVQIDAQILWQRPAGRITQI